jgi:hypothetical protein
MSVTDDQSSPDTLAIPVDDGPAGGEELQPLYWNVEEWVEAVFTTTWPRPTRGRWCSRWWEHAEAIVSLTALWQSWEAARIDEDPRAMADWLTRYLYPIMHELRDDAGPFASCSPDRHSDARVLPVVPAPPGYWPE